MHTVISTTAFLRDAREAGLAFAGIEEIEVLVGLNPRTGDEIVGTGGCRKLRVAGRGKGKSGGYRVVTFFSGPNVPVFLVTVFGKGEKSNLTRAECNELKGLTRALVDTYRKQVRRLGRGAP